MDLCFQKQKLYLFSTTHFRIFQSLKLKIFQDKSMHCCHTLLKIKNIKAIISGTIQVSIEIPKDLNFL
jgi:hypothetical protein